VTANGAATADLLATIVAATQRTVEVRQEREPFDELVRRAETQSPSNGGFLDALRRTDRINVIAECKRRSPSRGVLRAEYDPAAIAAGYAAAGAAAISVLTEQTFFDGSLAHLAAVRAAVDIPVLRKDFVVSEYQVVETRAAGASAVLLIVAALEPSELRHLLACAHAWGLDALVEVHALDELTPAVDAGAQIIGVNNRNLRTLEVDVRVSDVLIDRMPKDVVAISESGLRTPADLVRLRALGYRGFLIGERFMAAENPGAALQELLDGCGSTKDTKDTRDTKNTTNTKVTT
jgi:indole-3-glycerol phosphate synthase